jgi:hypothetical protein
VVESSVRTINNQRSAPYRFTAIMNAASRLAPCLELHLRSESENDGAVRATSHVCKVLNDRLQEEHRQRVQESVEFQAVLGLERSRARRVKLVAQAVVHIAEGQGVPVIWAVKRLPRLKKL